MEQIVRDIVPQPFTSFVLAVQITPTAISTLFTKAELIDSFVVSLDAAAANNVFIGDQGVTIASGLEIVRGGGPINFRILNQWQQYELQQPLVDANTANQCGEQMPRALPFIVWDLSQIYLVAVAATNVRIAPFRSQFI